MYKIERVSRMTGLSQKRIRDYEREGLIKPDRDSNTNDRLFSEFDVEQIRRIKDLLHKKGFTLPALKQLLVMAPGWKMFQCQEKETCEAFKNPHRRCWEVIRGVDRSRYEESCMKCPVYLLRETKAVELLRNPNNGT